MTKLFDVIWTAVAEDDLRAIILHIADENPGNARSVLAKIRERMAELEKLPEQGRVVPELLEQGLAHYREVVVAPWRVISRVEGRHVFVLSVIDARRNVEDVLLGRFLRG